MIVVHFGSNDLTSVKQFKLNGMVNEKDIYYMFFFRQLKLSGQTYSLDCFGVILTTHLKIKDGSKEKTYRLGWWTDNM